MSNTIQQPESWEKVWDKVSFVVERDNVYNGEVANESGVRAIVQHVSKEEREKFRKIVEQVLDERLAQYKKAQDIILSASVSEEVKIQALDVWKACTEEVKFLRTRFTQALNAQEGV